MTTFAPALTSRLTIPRPMPRAPPVTTALCPTTLKGVGRSGEASIAAEASCCTMEHLSTLDMTVCDHRPLRAPCPAEAMALRLRVESPNTRFGVRIDATSPYQHFRA